MRPIDIPDRLKLAALVVGGVAVFLLWGYLLTSSPTGDAFTPPPEQATGAGPTTAATRVAVVGGSFTAATPFGGQGQAGWPEIVGNRFGWQVTVFASDGAGYLTPGEGGLTLPAVVNNILASRPEVVLLAGGRADVGQRTPSAVAVAAGDMVTALRRQLPDSRLVVIGPVATDAKAPAGATQVRDAVRRAVTAVPNTSFVDPLDESWFADAPAGAIASDGQHPTNAGHQVIADKLAADLVRLGVARG